MRLELPAGKLSLRIKLYYDGFLPDQEASFKCRIKPTDRFDLSMHIWRH